MSEDPESFGRAYPVVVHIHVMWGDMDAFGHVNNTVYFRYFETARIAYFERLGWTETAVPEGVGPILAATSCRFRRPLRYPDTIYVGARVAALGEDRFRMEYAILSEVHQGLAATGDGVVVAFDYAAGTKTALPAAWRTAITRLEEGIGRSVAPWSEGA